MLQLLVNIAAVLGLGLAVLSLAWQIWTYRDQRRQRIEIRAAGYASAELPEPGAALGVDVVNVGSVPLYMARVELVFADEHRKWTHTAFLNAHPGGRLTFGVPVLDAEGAIEPGNARHYVLTEYEALHEALETPDGQLWIAAHTFVGEVARIDGATLRKELRFVVDYLDRHGTARARTTS